VLPIIQSEYRASDIVRPSSQGYRRKPEMARGTAAVRRKDVFVHISAVEKAGLSNLNEEQVIEFEQVANKGKTSAENLKVQR
jgi:cold shock CspA family protein